jgi:hypothetical protein
MGNIVRSFFSFPFFVFYSTSASQHLLSFNVLVLPPNVLFRWKNLGNIVRTNGKEIVGKKVFKDKCHFIDDRQVREKNEDLRVEMD